ncbi:MAG: hypothetical protein VX572_01790, partial [Chloroflexota bacterium]|nr:hypothetical protein [Chloroflexota bacterium]
FDYANRSIPETLRSFSVWHRESAANQHRTDGSDGQTQNLERRSSLQVFLVRNFGRTALLAGG